MQFCTTERPKLCEFEVATCTTYRLMSEKAILEVAMLICKNDGAFQKMGSMHADLTPPNMYSLFISN